MLRLLVGLIFITVLAVAGYHAGIQFGGRQMAELLALAGVFLASMILVATRTRSL